MRKPLVTAAVTLAAAAAACRAPEVQPLPDAFATVTLLFES